MADWIKRLNILELSLKIIKDNRTWISASLLGLLGSGAWGFDQKRDAQSYKQGYEALAHNVSVSNNPPSDVSRGTACDCSDLEKQLNNHIRNH